MLLLPSNVPLSLQHIFLFCYFLDLFHTHTKEITKIAENNCTVQTWVASLFPFCAFCLCIVHFWHKSDLPFAMPFHLQSADLQDINKHLTQNRFLTWTLTLPVFQPGREKAQDILFKLSPSILYIYFLIQVPNQALLHFSCLLVVDWTA